ncbi:sperm flagellar protein 2 isoform X3 [Arvicanthis niloticus]|uniref:sperm flagellar protein 2 isoform X3 n=1 Tax=Arvicanthis niloticus TaxID=61156 RepID=UPI00402B9F71
MSEILCQWLNQELRVSRTVSPKSFAKAFSNGYLIGEVLFKFELQSDFAEFSESRGSTAKLNNFSRLQPTLHLLGVQFDQNVAQSIITEKPGAATKLLYQLYIALQKKKKTGLTGLEIQTMQPQTNLRLQALKSEAFRERLKNLIPRQTDFNLMRVTCRFQEKCKQMKEDLARMHFEKFEKIQKLEEEQRHFNIEKQRLNRRRQNEIMAKIQAAIIQIPKPESNRTLKAIEAQKLIKKKKEAEDVANEIKKFEALIKKDLQAKESVSKTSLETTDQTTAELLNTYSDDDYIKKIQKRLEEDAFAREQREKRRRRLLMDQLIAHEAQEEAYREEQLIHRLMRQSQQERRIAVQLMHVRHEKEVLWQNRIFREKQFEERRLKDFQDALDREAALAKQAKIDFAEQTLREKEIHEKISVERAQERYEKHYGICSEILDQILDLCTKVADYRLLTNNLIPHKMMHDWKELFFSGNPIYEQTSLTHGQTESTDERAELKKRNLLDNNDYEEYKNMVGEWALPEDMVNSSPPSNNNILGHVLLRLIEKSVPSEDNSADTELPSFAVKGCILGKTLSGKTTVLKSLQNEFPIRVLSIDTLVHEAIQAFTNGEKDSKTSPTREYVKGDSIGETSKYQDTTMVPVSSVPGEATTPKEGVKMNESEQSRPSDSILSLSVRAQLGAKSELMLRRGKSIPDVLLVNILVNAIKEIPVDQSWVLDGFPITLNQAKLLEEALTGYKRKSLQLLKKKAQMPTLALGPTTSQEVSVLPSAFDFVILLDISDNSSLARINDITAKEISHEISHENVGRSGTSQDKSENRNLRDHIQHRIVGFLDNWPLLEEWFTEPKNILTKINAEIDEGLLCQKVKEFFATEAVNKKIKVEKKLEEKETEKKAAASLAESHTMTPPLSTEAEKDKELHLAKTSGKGKTQSVSPKGKAQGGKISVKKSPVGSPDVSPMPTAPQPVKPGSEEWVYVNEPIPEELPSFLVPYWELIEKSYINHIKTVLRHLRESQHNVLSYLYETRTSFQEFLRRPDHKQDFVSQWQADFNSVPEDLWEDEETKAELHQRVNDLRDRLWDICEARKEEAEQERLDIINESWLQDSIGITMNHFFSLMQAEVNRFQDTKRLLQDYYRAMESKIPLEDSKKFTRVPLVQLDGKEISENQLRIPLVPRISNSPENITIKPKSATLLKGRSDPPLEVLEANFEVDEKILLDTWQQASLAISHMVAAEVHQRLTEEEKEPPQLDSKEKSPQSGANKKAKKEKEPPKKKKTEKKGKGKSSPVAEVSPVTITPEEMAEMEKRNELKLRIKEEHLAALQTEEQATQFRLELIKSKAMSVLEDLVTKVIDVYRFMDKWLGKRYLNEMASIQKLTEVARYHIETATKIQNEIYLSQEDFYINGDIKVFPDPPAPTRPPPIEKEENGTLTIEQLDNLRDQFLDMAPKGKDSPDAVIPVTKKQRKSRKVDSYLPERNHQFLKIWLKKYPWLVYDELLNLMFCVLCRKHGVKSGGSTVGFFYGTDNFRAEFLNAHHFSEAHAKASLIEATNGSPVNRAATELMVRTMSKVTLGRVENLFRSCHALVKTGHPLKDFTWMCKLDDMKGVDIGPVFRTNKSARTFTYFIAEVERKNLREKLEKSNFFSVITDGIVDGLAKEAKMVYVQFAHAGKVQCQIVGIQPLEQKDPLTIKNAIEKTLETHLRLQLSSQDWAKKLVGFGSDDSPGIEGENRVVLLLREIQPCVQSMYCFAHHLELSYKAMLQSIPLYNDLEALLTNVYHFYHNSPPLKSSLITAFRGLCLQPVMPSQIRGTRWLHGLQAALQNFLKGYPAIVQQLHSVGKGKNDTSQQKANRLLELVLQADIIKFAHFLTDIISILSLLSHASRNRNSSIADVFVSLESTLEMLQIYHSRPGPKERRVDSATHLYGNCFRGEENISTVRKVVLTHLIERLRGCFRDASLDVVRATVIGSFRLWPTKINQGIIGNKAFTDILLDLVTLNLGTNNFPSSWMHLTQPDLQEITSILTVNTEFVDWRKFLMVAAMPWPIPLEEELLETLQKFKALDEAQTGTITFEQYKQAGLWFSGDEDIKIPENPLEPLPFNRQEHLIEFFFRLFADCEKDPPQLDYTQMLLYFACHPDTLEGVYRALSVAVGTHIFRQIETPMLTAEKTSTCSVSPIEEFTEVEESSTKDERELKEEKDERDQKEEEIPENANTEKISMETLLKVFGGGNEVLDANRFASYLKSENIYAENLIKTFQDLGAKNLEPIEVNILLKHPYIQDLIANYVDYKFPDIKMILQRSEHAQGSDGERSPSRLTDEKK